MNQKIKIHSKLSKHHPKIASICTVIGCMYFYSGEYAEPQNNYELAFSIRQDFLGDIHPSVAESYIDLANSLLNARKYEEALENYEKCLEIKKQN